jgi:hypothetical protein
MLKAYLTPTGLADILNSVKRQLALLDFVW